MPNKLRFEVYNKTRLAVRGDRELYNDLIKKIGGRWNSRMHGGEGWIISIEHKDVLEDLIKSLGDSTDLDETTRCKEDVDDSETQKGETDDEKERDNQEEEAREREREEKKAREREEEREEKKDREKEEAREREKEEKKAREKEERKSKLAKERRDIAEHAMSNESNDPLAYFRSFSKKPVDFRKLYAPSDSDNSSYSSSTSRSESSDDFPSPETPIKNKGSQKSEHNHAELFEKVNELQRKLYELEIKNRKLKAKSSHREY